MAAERKATEVRDTDVLVIGGGMAAAYAAIGAARAGAEVILVDKGFVGTSGVTATGGPNHWWVRPDPAARSAAIDERLSRAHGLAEPEWMARIIKTTWETLPQLAPYYPFSGDGRGGTYYSGLRGPEYMRALRRFALASGVCILDHHPALELLVHDDGSVAGASGHARLTGEYWTIRAGATVMATGGCAFRSGLIGSHGNVGDGYLMAAEAGAELSGMEFSTAYSLSPAWNSTRTLPYPSARFFDAEGQEIDVPPVKRGIVHEQAIAAAMLKGPVFAELHDAPALLKQLLPRIQPASPTPFERRGINLFEDRFEVKLFGEGTIRGTGGLRIIDRDCQTSVAGLYAAGDTATREPIAGATSGGGAQNSAWALTSGLVAGEAAASRARTRGRRASVQARPVGTTGLRPSSSAKPIDEHAALSIVQGETLPYDKVLWRTAESLSAGVDALNDLWSELSAHHLGPAGNPLPAREIAAMTATARWATRAALDRPESRGMHRRADHPEENPTLGKRLIVSGLDQLSSRFDREDALDGKVAA